MACYTENTTDSEKELIKKALKDFKFSAETQRRNRDNYADDIDFVFKSNQWPESIKNERENDERPCLTVNKLKKFVKNVAGDIRQNMPDVKFRPVDSVGDPIIADLFSDIKRSINTSPEARMADKNAAECALAGGFGYYRFTTEYDDEDPFNQVIKKKRIPNALTVYLDPSAMDYLYKDGDFALITEKMKRESFERMYPDADPVSFESIKEEYETYGEWIEEDYIRVAEYFYKEYVEKTYLQMDDGSIYELKEGEDREALEEELGLVIVNERTIETHQVMWCKMTAVEIIEGPQEWPGRHIPIVPVLGDEESMDGTRTFYSLIREAKDPQRMYNYWRTMAAELIALAPKSPYIGTPEQFDGHEAMWQTANVKNFSHLMYNHVPNQPRPQRERAPELPAAAVNEANIATADVMDAMGKYQASIGQASNERSGTAIIERKKEGDATTFSFIDNLHMSVIYEGEILLDLIPRVYDNERILRLRGEDDEDRVWEINKVVLNEDFEEVVYNDLTVGKYDVVPDAGASYATKRAEIANSLLGVMQFAPMLAPAIVPRLAKAIDMPDAEGLIRDIEAMMQPQPQPAAGGGPTSPAPGGGAPAAGEQMALPMGGG